MKPCEFCKTHYRPDPAAKLDMCPACATKLGLIEMPPATRPAKACARCDGRKFVRCIPREHTSAQGGETNSQISAPMLLTHTPEAHHGWLLDFAKELDMTKGYGRLEVYACWGCGAVEWYCANVRDIPIHPRLMTELIDYDADRAPYR